MINHIVAQGKIKNGWITFNSYFKSVLSKFCQGREGKLIWIEIMVGNIRSIAQNKFLHGPIIDAFVRASGDTDRDFWKWFLKDKFLRVYRADGSYWVKGTSELTIGEFADFLNHCIAYLQDQHGGYLTDVEHRDYIATLSKKEVDFYKENRDQVKMPWHQPGVVK